MYFYLDLGHDDVLAYYQGHYQVISALTTEGLRIEFPASAIKPYVSHDGIHGLFAIEFDDNHKLVGVQRVESAT